MFSAIYEYCAEAIASSFYRSTRQIDSSSLIVLLVLIDKYSLKKKNKVNSQHLFRIVLAKILFLSKKMLPFFQKDVLPAHKRSNIVYKYSCHCDSVYVGTAIRNNWKNKFNNMFQNLLEIQVKPQADLP